MFTIQSMTVGILETNCYLLKDEEANQAVLVDPGGKAGRIQPMLEEIDVHPAMILITHGHIDHYQGAVELSRCYQCPILIHQREVAYLSSKGAKSAFYSESGAKQLQEVCYGLDPNCPKARLLQDGEMIKAGSICLKAIEVPGHSDHSLCFYAEDRHLLICGDTIFSGGIGRTDLYNGDPADLIQNIKARLLILPDDTVVLPGHGPATTIGEEKRTNPYLGRW